MTSTPKSIEAITHDDAKRTMIPTAEFQAALEDDQKQPKPVRYPRNTDLDPQLVWRGKDEQDWSDLVVHAPPLYIQEKVHPKALIDDLLRESKEREYEAGQITPDLFSDFNGIPKDADKTEFYQHDQNWTNRMILGDSLHVMASLAEREGLRGKVQCIYFDPPYGIKFNSNFQWSTTSRDVKDGKADHITREPEQVKAFRDTWRDGIHSYLTYLRDRLTVARDLLTDSGSIFVQIGDENVHRVRAVMDEVFGEENCVSLIGVAKTTGSTEDFLGQTTDYLLWYCRDKQRVKYRTSLKKKRPGEKGGTNYNRVREPIGFGVSLTADKLADPRIASGDWRIYSLDNLTSQSSGRDKGEGAASWFGVELDGRTHKPSLTVRWKTNEVGMARLKAAGRLEATASRLGYVRYLDDFPAVQVNNRWDDVGASFMADKIYVVQTSQSVVQRAILMSTDPGDLVLDPTCGSGTTATVAEQWGRRWITIDTSRVALALARARIMGARYPFYLLADSPEGQRKEAEVTRTAPRTHPTHGNIRHGFVYERVPHITLKSIANNAEIDVIWDKWQETLEPLREQLNAALGRFPSPQPSPARGEGAKPWQEWEIPREADAKWPDKAKQRHTDWWQARIARQKEIDASIAAKAEFEYLYDKPYENKKAVRVAGPFTVESLSPHRTLGVDENDELIDTLRQQEAKYAPKQSFPQMILDNLKTAGVQQAHKEDRIVFTALTPWPGERVCAEGRYLEGESLERRAAIFIGSEFGTVQRADLAQAAREALEAGFDVLIACAFNFEAHANEFAKLGKLPVLKARMNADLHMAEDLKNTGKGNLFVIFGEPDITLLHEGEWLRVKVNGVDLFKPQTGEVVSHGAEGIACWFIDTDYNEESFFVRHAYFLGAGDPYKALKTTLKAEIDAEAWASLNSDTSRAFKKPKSGRIAVKVINHLGDEVMKVFRCGDRA
jgi:adenine-specific DNA-methyltransferase